ncbi:putative membrane protein DUF2157 [Flavobacterium araucananum]|jgi:hypothetical protein|uniref:DUF2157 domain-containing protein n=1 Tax=Flavobacterium araucananum TaxID=946678 RepID=A0A227NMR7_9FLAO|nr:DUF2157 domain-containing protein [Flavobacterium araucananum]OXE99130.1 DUF2157 domain-containing protein [Flavobacterium araucananum]PWK01076.1 putative membrane protein DUF2157 [Flavobacterium araucananum]
MNKFDDQATKALLERNLITENQYQEVATYRNLNIFSLNAELKLFLYLSVLSFTSGIGILIYNNIDTIGHIAILSLLLVVIGVCFYYCFKNSKGFQKQETTFENPVLEYLVLAGNILTCIFIGYLQFQYKPFGTHYGLATLIPTLVSFFCAYYFDNKSVLTIAITGLAAYVGLSVTPQDLLNNSNFYEDQTLSYSAIALGGLLILWTIYSTKNQLKTHFNVIYLTFALHIISIAAISSMIDHYDDAIWFLFVIVLGASSFYFYKISHEVKAMSLYVFTIIYGYIGFNIFLFKIFENVNFSDVWELFILLLPAYFIGSIVLFIKLIKNFNKEIAA